MPWCLHSSEECNFARAGLAPIHQQADRSSVLLGHEAGEREDVDQLPAAGLEATSEIGVKQPLGPHAIGVGVRTNHHDRNSLGSLTAGRKLQLSGAL
jgi:hypothetical protein